VNGSGDTSQARRHSVWWAILAQRCPRCRQGRIFGSLLTMNPECPSCQLIFEREPGYFMGALYVSYGMASSVLGLLVLAGHLLFPEIDLGTIVLGALVPFLLFVPSIFRYSRVLWIHFDRWAWPDVEEQ
jgi:hypothetical protein